MINPAEQLSENVDNYPPLTRAYARLLDELASGKYVVRNVFEHYFAGDGRPDAAKPTVVLRIDVDSGFHLSWPLAMHLHRRGLTASHYFLTHPARFYDIWGSEIPRRIHKLGQEVGVHTDHYYEQLAFGIDALEELRADIQKLANLIGAKVKGMVYHGHPTINALGKTNWELTKNLHSSELGLDYHDGFKSCYIQPGSEQWRPKCDYRISDFMGIPRSWGWNYLPSYPTSQLKKHAKANSVVHIAFHTLNAFEYWQQWPKTYGEVFRPKEPWTVFQKKRMLILEKLAMQSLYEHLPNALKNNLKKLKKRRPGT